MQKRSEAPLRVLYVFGSTGLSGVTAGLLGLLKGSRPGRILPILAAPGRHPIFPIFRREGVPCLSLPKNGEALFLQRLIRKQKIDLVHSLHPDGAGARAAYLSGLPHVWYVSGLPEEVFSSPLGTQQQALAPLMARLSDAIIVSSRDLHRRLLPKLRRKAHVIPLSGLPSSAPVPARRRPARSNFKVALTANYYPAKHHIDFLLAAKEIRRILPRTEFLIAGGKAGGSSRQRRESAAYFGKVRSEARRLGLNNAVRFTRYPLERRMEWMRQIDLLIVPSFEGLGQQMLEAGACGVPVIAADAGGAREIVWHGRTGLRVPIGNVHALAQAAIRLLRDPKTRARMGNASRERVMKKYAPLLHARRVESLYRRLTRERTGRSGDGWSAG